MRSLCFFSKPRISTSLFLNSNSMRMFSSSSDTNNTTPSSSTTTTTTTTATTTTESTSKANKGFSEEDRTFVRNTVQSLTTSAFTAKLSEHEKTPRDARGWRNIPFRDEDDIIREREQSRTEKINDYPLYNPNFNQFVDKQPTSKFWGKNHHFLPTSSLTVKEVIKIGRHTKPTKGGRQLSYSALVLVGNEKGTAGLGFGRAATSSEAVVNGTRDAEKHLVHLKTFRGRSNISRVKLRNRGCVVTKTPYTKDVGVRGCPMVQTIAGAFGIGSLAIKITGPSTKSTLSRSKTVFEALKRNRDPEVEAKAMGKILFNRRKVWRRREYTHIY